MQGNGKDTSDMSCNALCKVHSHSSPRNPNWMSWPLNDSSTFHSW